MSDAQLLSNDQFGRFFFDNSRQYPNVPMYLRIEEYTMRRHAMPEETRILSKQIKRKQAPYQTNNWTLERTRFLLDNFVETRKMSGKEVAEALGISLNAMYIKAKRLKKATPIKT